MKQERGYCEARGRSQRWHWQVTEQEADDRIQLPAGRWARNKTRWRKWILQPVRTSSALERGRFQISFFLTSMNREEGKKEKQLRKGWGRSESKLKISMEISCFSYDLKKKKPLLSYCFQFTSTQSLKWLRKKSLICQINQKFSNILLWLHL